MTQSTSLLQTELDQIVKIAKDLVREPPIASLANREQVALMTAIRTRLRQLLPEQHFALVREGLRDEVAYKNTQVWSEAAHEVLLSLLQQKWNEVGVPPAAVSD
jgi:hypothetical protein